MNKIKQIANHSKKFIVDHKVEITATCTAVIVAAIMHKMYSAEIDIRKRDLWDTMDDYDGFLKEHNLYNTFYNSRMIPDE